MYMGVRKLTIAVFLISILFVIGCTDLPLEPGQPGTKTPPETIGGKAIEPGGVIPSGYAPPWDIFNDNLMIFTTSPSDIVFELGFFGEKNMNVKVSQDGGLIYKYGYIYKKAGWESYKFSGETIGGSDWIESSALASVQLSTEDFSSGENYLVAYSCKKHSGEWKCGCASENDCGYWMLQSFDITIETLPEEPSFCGNKICEEQETEENCPEDCIKEVSYPDLSDYPDFFFENGKFTGIIVVDDNAPAEHIIAATNIALSLEVFNPEGVPNTIVKLASEIADPNIYDLILIGGCSNSLSRTIMELPLEDCFVLEDGYARIKLYRHAEGKIAMIIEGGTAADVRKAASVVANYEDYVDFAGEEVCVRAVGTVLTVDPCPVEEPPIEVEENETEEAEECTDSDAGKDYYVKGTTTGYDSTFGYHEEEDNCVTNPMTGEIELEEHYCNPNIDMDVWAEHYKCPNDCEDGACMLEEEDIVCENYTYSNCPEPCETRCVSSSCSEGQCTDDCDGPGSCINP